MAELTPKERLQPALLDRLTDDEPEKQVESRERRVISMRRLRESVLRDLAWLFNAINLGNADNIQDYRYAAQSVINYGLPDLAGRTAAGTDPLELERLLQQVIYDFEPRILKNSVKVRAVSVESGLHQHNILAFDVEGELWGQPAPVHMYVKTQFDLESGSVKVADLSGSISS
jgi:type VI secretion system protein ImpF